MKEEMGEGMEIGREGGEEGGRERTINTKTTAEHTWKSPSTSRIIRETFTKEDCGIVS